MAIRDATSSRWGHSAWRTASRTCCGHAPSRRKRPTPAQHPSALALVERRRLPRSRPRIPRLPRSDFVAPPAQSETNVPGIETGGGFERMARLADKMAFVRVLRTHSSGHGGGTVWMHTGLPIRSGKRGAVLSNPSSTTRSSPAFGAIPSPACPPTSASTPTPGQPAPLAGQPIHCIQCPQGRRRARL